MRAWQATVQDERGNAVFNPLVTVYEEDGVTLANIYNEDGSPKENPFTGTTEGFAQFWADRGTYRVVGADGNTISERWQVDLADEEALQLASAADAKATEAQAVIDSQVTPAQLRKNTLDATRAPLPSDDETQGYAVGSRWLWQGQEWVATEVVAGAAVWSPSARSAFASREDAEATRIPPPVTIINVAGLQYVRDPDGTALTTAGGVKWSPCGSRVSLLAFGAKTSNAAADNNAAFSMAIAWLNGGSGRILVVPSGSLSISNAIPAITQSDVEIVGEAGAELFKIASAVDANFFIIGGSAGPVTNRVKIHGITCEVENGGPASGYVAALDNTVDCEVSDIRCENVPGLIKLGAVADTARTTFRRWTGNFNSDANKNLCVFRRWSGLKLADFKVYGAGGATKRTADTFNFQVVGLCDTLHFDRVEVFSPSSADFAIDCSIDNGSIVNCWFNDCVFDKHGSASGAVRIASTAASTASSYDLTTGFWRAQNWHFNNCRWDTGGGHPGGTAVRITQLASTGFSRISGIHFKGCDFIYRDMEAIETVHTGTDGLKNITVRDCNFLEASIAPITDCIRMGNSGFNISGNSNSYSEANEAPNTTNFVKTTADVDNFVISGNMIEASTTAVSHFAYAVASTSRQVYGNTETTGELP